MIDNFTKDLYLTVSKYIEVSPEKFQIRIQRSEIQITFTGEDFLRKNFVFI